MKKTILLLSTALTMIASCKNDDPEPEAKRQTIYDTTKVVEKYVDSIYHHFYDSIYHHFYDTLAVYDTVRVPILCDHSWVIYINEDDVDTVEVKNGTSINLKSDLKRYGYDFVNWSTDKTGLGMNYKAGDNFQVDKDITLYAIWQSHEGLHSDEVYDFLSQQENGNTVNVRVIDLYPNLGLIETALTKFWKVNVNLDIEEGTQLTDVALKECSNLLSIKLPNNIKRITISNCSNLKEINIPYGVKYLELIGCGFSSIDIPETVTEIGYWGFLNCKNLKEIVIPSGVDNMRMMFDGCCKLESIKHSLKECSYVNFQYCSSLKSIVIPELRPEVNGYFFIECQNLEEITFEDTTPYALTEWFLDHKATIYVPSSALEAYKTADVWKDHTDQIVGY